MENQAKYDVVIIGGGTSGCACAYISSMLNLKTLLVEKNNFFGGLMTAGLVVPVMKSSVVEYNCDYYHKLVSTAKKYNAQITYKDKNDGWFNPELLKIVLDEILSNSKNLDILFETNVLDVIKKDNSICSIILNSNLLSIPVEANYFIDATGSGEFSRLCGCSFLKDTNTKQQNSLRFILGNVDIEKFCNFIKSIDFDEDITNTYRNEIDTNNELHFTTASTWDTSKYWALDKILQQGVKDCILEEKDRSYFQIFSIAGAKGEVAFNCPRMTNSLGNPFKHSNDIVEARKAIYRLYNFVKKYFEGFENSIIVNIAQQTGIREQNRIKSKYIYKKDDIFSAKKFKNPVLEANYPIDIHSDKKNGSILTKTLNYQLPIESLMSDEVDNLYAIGKLVGAEFETHSALRVQKSCMSMGEAVAKHIKQRLFADTEV